MSDVRIKPFNEMTDGTYAVNVDLEFTIDGNNVSISDHSDQPVGDVCAALHYAALQAIGGEILEARNTDAFERKPFDPGKVSHGERQSQSTKG